MTKNKEKAIHKGDTVIEITGMGSSDTMVPILTKEIVSYTLLIKQEEILVYYNK